MTECVECVDVSGCGECEICRRRRAANLETKHSCFVSVRQRAVLAAAAEHIIISALETFVIIALYKSTFTIPYHQLITLLASAICLCLQCFDTVGLASGRASGV